MTRASADFAAAQSALSAKFGSFALRSRVIDVHTQ
jgi:hypothetical protein